jgi:WD40 repeat protein
MYASSSTKSKSHRRFSLTANEKAAPTRSTHLSPSNPSSPCNRRAVPSQGNMLPNNHDRFIPSRVNMHMGINRRKMLSRRSRKPWKPSLQKEYASTLQNAICSSPGPAVNENASNIGMMRLGAFTSSLPLKSHKECFKYKNTDWTRDDSTKDLSLFARGPDGRIAIACRRDIDVFQTTEKALNRRNCEYISLHEGFEGRINLLSWCPHQGSENYMLALSGSGDVTHIDMNVENLLYYNTIPSKINVDCKDSRTAMHCDWNPAIAKFCSIAIQDRVFMVDLKGNFYIDGDFLHLEWERNQGDVTSVKWKDDGHHILVAFDYGDSSAIRCYDYRAAGHRLGPAKWHIPYLWECKHRGRIKSLDWCHFEQNRFVSAETTPNGDVLRLYDSCTGEILSSVNTRSEISAIASSRNGPEICTSHGKHMFDRDCDNSLQLWNYNSTSLTSTNGIRSGRQHPVVEMALNPRRGTDIATLSMDGTVQIYDVFNQTPLRTVRKEDSRHGSFHESIKPSHMWYLGSPKFSDAIGLDIR